MALVAVRLLVLVCATVVGIGLAGSLQLSRASAAVVGAAAGGVVLGLEIAVALRRRGPLSPGRASVPGVMRLVDTSAIVDGRLADIAACGFVDGTLTVPRFVLRELQQLADSGDPLRRSRGRRGFEILQRLQAQPGLTVAIDEEDVLEARDVDAKLLALAGRRRARILTTDYNLNRLAEVTGVGVLNVNDLANALRPVLLPGEELRVRLLREGKEAGQGVGFLDDGTMVVVDQARRLVGQEVGVVVTSALQTSAGRMIFARLRAEDAGQRDA